MSQNRLLVLLLGLVIVLSFVILLLNPSFLGLFQRGFSNSYTNLTEEEKKVVDETVSLNSDRYKVDKSSMSADLYNKNYDQVFNNMRLYCDNLPDEPIEYIKNLRKAYSDFVELTIKHDPSILEKIKIEQKQMLEASGSSKLKYLNNCIIQDFTKQ